MSEQASHTYAPPPAGLPGLSSERKIPTHVPEGLVFDPPFEVANALTDPFSLNKKTYEELPPVFWWPRARPGRFDGTWVVTHYDDIRNVYQKEELYSTEGTANFQSLVGETWPMLPIAVDPPEHGKYRILLNPWFSPKAVAAMETNIRTTINDLIDGFQDKGEVDVAYDFGRVYPVRVFLDLMGFPQEKLDEFLDWGYSILHSRYKIEKIQYGVSSALVFLRDFIAKARENPVEGLASYIVHGKIEGRALTDDEVIGMVFFLWVAGLDTVAANTTLMMRRLALEPEIQATLRAKPELIPDAVEEFLRVQPVVNSSRLVKEDHEVRGVQIKKGDHILCYNIAGNFDDEEFDNPWELRFDRPSNRHFSLAGGPHRCLGSHLARRELRIALGEFLRRIPTFSLKPGVDHTVTPGLVATPHLHLVWDPKQKP